jgi:integral membrane sensor domain MASE1
MSEATPESRHSRVRDVLTATAVAIAYFGAAKIGLRLAFVHVSASAVWPPTGIALAACLILGQRAWPGIFAGAFLANLTNAGSVATSLGIALGNTLEGVIGSYLVRRFAGGIQVFDQPRDIHRYAFLAGMASTAVSATFGVTSLALGGFVEWSRYWPIWATWWLGDLAGALVVAPVLILWYRERHVSWNGWKLAEGAALLATLLLVALFVFAGLSPLQSKNYPLAFLCIPILAWIAFRFSQREAATAIVILAGIALVGTLNGLGPFVVASPNSSLLILQSFLAVVAMVLLATTAAVNEGKRVQEFVRRINEELEERVARRTEELRSANNDLRAQILERLRAQEELERIEELGVGHREQHRVVVRRALRHLRSRPSRVRRQLSGVSRAGSPGRPGLHAPGGVGCAPHRTAVQLRAPDHSSRRRGAHDLRPGQRGDRRDRQAGAHDGNGTGHHRAQARRGGASTAGERAARAPRRRGGESSQG